MNGILFGRRGGPVPESSFEGYDQVLLQVVSTELGLNDPPIVARMDFGHTDPMLVLPLGRAAVIDCARRTLSTPEAAVADRLWLLDLALRPKFA